MNDNIGEKLKGTLEIEDKMSEQIKQQEEDIQKQIELYKEGIETKKKEEADLKKILDDYKTKYKEFDNGIKQSRKTLG